MYRFEVKWNRGTSPDYDLYAPRTAEPTNPNGVIEIIEATTFRPMFQGQGEAAYMQGVEFVDSDGNAVAAFFQLPRSIRRLGPVEQEQSGD